MRRRLLALPSLALAAFAALTSPAAAQFGEAAARPAPAQGARPLVDQSLLRTVSLVLRSTARRDGLDAAFTDPTPLTEAQYAALQVGARLAPDFPATPAPPAVNDRLPHVRSSSVWATAGTWMIEVDPTRMIVLTVAPDILPPDL